MCLTFARPKRLLEEAVFSFLRQDYEGDKELLILNDHSDQTVQFRHPEVTVVNLPVRFRTLGEKRNAAVALCKYDLLAVWDDDDIYLPHRLRFSVSKYDQTKRFFKPTRALVIDEGTVSGPKANVFHSGSMWHRSLFNEVGGYRHMNGGEDADLETRFYNVIGPGKDYAIEPQDIYYLYRWAGTNSYHLSAFGQDGHGKTGVEKVLEFVQRQQDEGRVETGALTLEPYWASDYVRLADDHLAKVAGKTPERR
jgi:hypothetical protein